MTQDEVIKLAAEAGFKWPDICETTIEQRLGRFANLIAVAEREKCTGTQEFVTLPREVVERALEALEHAEKDSADFQCINTDQTGDAIAALRAALDRPQNHVPDAGNMVPAGWKLVPVVPTDDMEAAAETDYEQFNGGYFPDWLSAYRAMLAAAPQPPTTEDCSVVLPQANQPAMTPIAQRKLDSLLAEGYTISGYSIYHEQKHQHGFVTGAGLVGWWKPEGVEHVQPQGEQEPFTVLVRKRSWLANQWEAAPRGFPDYGRSWADDRVNVYTHQQPKREPLTDEQILGFGPGQEDAEWTYEDQLYFARAIENAHNIK